MMKDSNVQFNSGRAAMIISWTCVVAITIIGGSISQILLWGRDHRSIWSTLLHCRPLWLFYLICATMIGERLHRYIYSRLKER